jgi:RNA polymerase sigma-70 factor (ECF subfamily)
LKNQNSEIAFLLQQCKEHNKKAQLAIYNQYYSAMFNVAFRIVNDKTLAEEVMQDGFLSAFTKLDSYSGTVTFGAWLKKIVVNRSINELKKNSNYHTESLNENFELVDPNDEESLAVNSLKAEQVLKIMQGLKPNYKVILTLFFIEGYDLEEISGILNISNENCRTIMSRAKESLRKKANEYGA